MSSPDLYIQWGCGQTAGEGWLNFDASYTVLIEQLPFVARIRGRRIFPAAVRYGDIVKGLPVAADACAAVYCSHTLEHLPLNDALIALRNTYRILRPGGVFRMVLPNLRAIVSDYLDSEDPAPAHKFMRWSNLGTDSLPKTPLGALREWLARGRHLWMWDESTLRHELAEVGFVGIRRCAYGDSSNPMFERVEVKERYEWDALALECFKP